MSSVPLGTPLCRICNRYVIAVNAEGKCRHCAKPDKDNRRRDEFMRKTGNFFESMGRIVR